MKQATNEVSEDLPLFVQFWNMLSLSIVKHKSIKMKKLLFSLITVSLTYLRGLEIPELNEDEMPMI